MISRSRAYSEDRSDLKRPFSWPFSIGEGFRSALRLLGSRQRLSLLWLIAERVAVGLCDLLLAGAMYLLFLLLQGASPAHHRWWTPKTTLSAALITAVLVVLRALIDLSSTRSVVRHMQNLYTELLLRLTRDYNEMLWIRFTQRNRSELLNHCMYTAREAANFYQFAVELIASALVVIAMTAALIYRSPAAACGLGVTVTVFYGMHRFLLRKRLQRSASEREQSLRILQKSLADMFSSGREIRSYGIEAFFHARISGQARSAAASYQRLAVIPQIARILADQGVLLLFVCVVIAVQLHHGDARQLLSLLVFYFVLSRRLLPLVSQMSFMAGQMEGSYKNVQIIADELGECSLHRMATPPVHLAGGELVLELDQVSFSFNEGPWTLRSITFCLRRGEVVVLHGVSGSGKSSLMNIIAGVLQPASGMVRVDRASVAYVPQDVAMLDDSIRNNLLFGLPAKSDAELMNALAAANLAEFVAAQPRGLDAGIGDNGVLFSGGQRQRLGLARAILRSASLLLLDEATSALDGENESQVLENLSASGVAVLLVTHRALKQGFADRVFRLEEGRLIEEAIEVTSVPSAPVESVEVAF
jgi:ABC-type multidrug transport system fused ATPase/permease subunit